MVNLQNDKMFGLAKQYFRKGKKGFTSAIVTGERRIGKTMYSLQTVYQICRYEGQTPQHAWDSALNSIVFTMGDLVRIIKKHNHDNRRRFLIWDDSGVYGSGLLYQYNVDNAMILKALMDTIGTRVRLLMLTCPDIEGLMHFLRRYQDFLIYIEPHGATWGAYGRLATVLKPYRRKNLARGWKRAWSDEYNIMIDDRIYNLYEDMRDKYADIIIKELLKRGKEGRDVAKQTYGEDNELVRQSELLDDVAKLDSASSLAPDRGE